MTQSNLTFTEGQEIPKGYKNTELGIFPEQWKLMTIQEALDSKYLLDQMDGNHGELYPRSNEFSQSGIAYIGATDFSDNKVDFKNCKFLPLIRAKKFRKGIAKSGDVLFAHNATVGPAALLKTDDEFVILSTTATYYRCNDKHISNQYLLSFFQSNTFKQQYTAVMSQSTRNQVSILAQRKFKLLLPSRVEQQKIATALSDKDALISELEKLIEKKQAIKTATMQQLLTGKTRLPEFALREDGTPKAYKESELGQIPEDWGVYPLKSLLKSQPKYGINAAATQLSGDLPTYLRITDIDENGKFNPSEKVGVDSPLSGNYILEQGDIVLARTGASVGKSYLYDKDDGELVYAGFLIKISPAPNLLCSKYLSIYLQTKEYWDWIATNSMRSGQPGINGNQYASLKIVLPSFNEQLKISRIFKDIDRDLEQLKIKLDKVTLLKQGMMQELLTGKTRLV